MKKSKVYEEESFPRDVTGGQEELKSNEIKKGRKRPADDLEPEDSHILPVIKRQKTGDKSKNDFRQKPLSFHLEKDLLVLGCVSEIKDYDVMVTLPDGLKGKLPITDICDSYTQKLQKLACGNGAMDEDDAKLLSLHNIFHPGSIVRCRITDLDKNTKKKSISLSINPKAVNMDILEIQDNTTITGAISSIEDHGFEVDVGVSGKKAFLPKEEITEFVKANKSFVDNIDFSIGSYLTCLVSMKKHEKKVVSRVVSLTLNPKKVASARHSELNLNSLLPGMVVNCSVDSKLDAGIMVTFGNNSGIIFNNNLETSQDKYEVYQELAATVLYIQPVTKVVVLSQLKHLQNPAQYASPFGSLDVGNISEGPIIKVVPKIGMYVKLEGNIKGFVKKNQVSDKSVELKNFKKGESHKCRIIGYDHLNNTVLLTMKESLLKMSFFNYQDIKLGQVIDCSVKKLNQAGLVVKISGRISGLVPRLHLSDIPLSNPEKKFKEGREIKCRVLSVNVEESKLMLTHKKSLVKPKNLLPFSYDEVTAKAILTGFVVLIKPNGLLVAFGGDVKGWVPKKDLSYEVIDNPEKKFYLGQILECRVKFSKPDEQKIVLSLKISDVGDKSDKLEAKAKKVVEPIVERKKEEKKKSEETISVEHSVVESEVKECGVKESKEVKPKSLQLPRQFNWEEVEDDIEQEPMEEQEREIPKKVKIDVLLNKTSQEKRMELERMTLLEPNESQHWIKLVSFEMEDEGIEKAREVSERALKSILFRLEQEKLNVRLCRLNLEHAFGTSDSLRSYYESCLSYCDQFKVMSHMRDLRASAGEVDKAVDICKIMVKKFKEDPKGWESYGLLLYKSGQKEIARIILRECLDKLHERHHVLIATKFALLESEYGVSDISDTMFENILRNFPKHTDVWSIYVDRCIKLNRHDQARNVLRRATSIEPALPTKKAAFLMKKFIAFEEAHGSPLVVDELKGRLAKIMNEDGQQ